MKIIVTYGVGKASTELAAFHNALKDAGIEMFNIIKLSSVIPANATVIVDENKQLINQLKKNAKVGDKLYAVIAEKAGNKVAAGLGWSITDNGGIFVEHVGKNKQEVEMLIRKSLSDIGLNNVQMKIVEAATQSESEIACAVVCAVYAIGGWDNCKKIY